MKACTHIQVFEKEIIRMLPEVVLFDRRVGLKELLGFLNSYSKE